MIKRIFDILDQILPPLHNPNGIIDALHFLYIKVNEQIKFEYFF